MLEVLTITGSHAYCQALDEVRHRRVAVFMRQLFLDGPQATLTLSTPGVRNCCCSKGLAPYWSNRPFLISDIRALWRSVLSARAPECQKLKTVGQTSMAKCDLNGMNGERVNSAINRRQIENNIQRKKKYLFCRDASNCSFGKTVLVSAILNDYRGVHFYRIIIIIIILLRLFPQLTIRNCYTKSCHAGQHRYN